MRRCPHVLADVHDVEQDVHSRLAVVGFGMDEVELVAGAVDDDPGAALEQTRSAGRFTPVPDAWWAAAVKAHSDKLTSGCPVLPVLSDILEPV